MGKQTVLIFSLLLLALGPVSAQHVYGYEPRPDSVLNLLIRQRSKLFREWEADKQERNAFFGGQSKNDLRNIIETLEHILGKDNDILAELNRLKQQEVNEWRNRHSDAGQKMNDYLRESTEMVRENRQLKAEVERLNRQLKRPQGGSSGMSWLWGGLLLATGTGLGWLVARRK